MERLARQSAPGRVIAAAVTTRCPLSMTIRFRRAKDLVSSDALGSASVEAP